MNLDELTKLEAAMTPGPWAGGNTADIFVDSDGAKTGERGTHVCDCDPLSDKTFAEARADRNGIVALRNAAPALIECAELLWKHAVIPCGDCNGTGYYLGKEDRDGPCDICGGTGNILPHEVAAALARLEGTTK